MAAVRKLRASLCAALSSPLLVNSENCGIAMAARMPMIATTIINSISVNPPCRLSMLFIAFRCTRWAILRIRESSFHAKLQAQEIGHSRARDNETIANLGHLPDDIGQAPWMTWLFCRAITAALRYQRRCGLDQTIYSQNRESEPLLWECAQIFSLHAVEFAPRSASHPRRMARSITETVNPP